MSASLPGTAAHQALLRSIIDAYADDERVLAIGLLGSLGRGTWDEWSDLDLDIVVTDDALIDAVGEAQVLCARIGHAGALVVPNGPGEVDVVLRSLEWFSIRYHTLGTTNAHIVDDLKIVAGRLDRAMVISAGLAPARPARVAEVITSEALRFALSVDISLRRGNIWQALRGLDDLRWRLEELFAVSGSYLRPAHEVDMHASAALKEKLGALQAQADVDSIAQCLARALELISDKELTRGRLVLTPAQQAVASALRLRRPLSGGAGVPRASSRQVDDALSARDFYTRTMQYMQNVDPSWHEERVQRGIAAERLYLRSVLGHGQARTALDCSCGPGTQVVSLVELGWRVTGLDTTAALIEDGRARAERMGITAGWHVGDMQELNLLFSPGSFDLVLSCMALDNILDDVALHQVLTAMHGVLTPSGRCYLRLRDLEHVLTVRPHYDVREERQLPHARVIHLEDWHYENERDVVNFWIFLREDTRRSGYRWDTAIFAYRRRVLRKVQLEALLREAGFSTVAFLPQSSPWDPFEVIAHR